MRIRIKQKGFFRDKKVDSTNKVEDIIIKENLIEPHGENITIFFRGPSSSGIMNFSYGEAEMLISSLKKNLGLVKKVKKIRG